MNIVVLAAGLGKRMKSDLHKVLHPIAGRPMLAHLIDRARSLSALRIIIVHGQESATLRAALDAPDLDWVLQSPPRGTGHAVQQAIPLLDHSQPTLVLFGDVPLTRTATLQALADAAGSDRLALLTATLEDPTGYGRIIREGERIVAIIEEKDADARTRTIHEINTGILMAPTPPLLRWLADLSDDNIQREYYLTDIVAAAVADGVAVVSVQPQDNWETLGVNSKRQLATLERIYQREQAHALMDEGVMLADPARIDVRGRLRCGSDVSIDINCVFEGEVELGDGVSIGANCVLRDVRVGSGTRVLPFTMMEGANIANDARVGPFSRVRPGARLGTRVQVGNFTEIKASTLGTDSKANHLSYVGDAIVGERVNIGAGTITCNYDGAAKHLTRIEDDVNIGSDTQLVAPVTIGRGATTAAGTTVWRDVPAQALALNTKDQAQKADWQRPTKPSVKG
jgi:bifunctional UDP-N-acetylglucosamine pyrophosphorylase/glucosamine-1-phosphate N-acetyltransferase